MRLTNSMRSAFIRAAIDDIPSVDNDEQIQKCAKVATVSIMPTKVREAYKAHPEWFLDLSVFFNKLGSIYLPLPIDKKLPAETVDKLCEMNQRKKEQETERNMLRQRLDAAAKSVATRKALAALLPEFEKYLPADDSEVNRTLPVVANIVADFVKAGWPKKTKK